MAHRRTADSLPKGAAAGFPPLPPTAPAFSSADPVAFIGIIKSVKATTDAAGDKVGSLTIGFRPDGSTIADLDKVHKPDHEVYVVVFEKANADA